MSERIAFAARSDAPRHYDPMMSFEAPIWLWLALLGIPAAITAIRLLGSMTLMRRWTAAIARAALIALIAITLAGAASVRRTQRLAVIAVIDASGSVQRYAGAGTDDQGRPVAALDRIRQWLAGATRDRGPDDLLGLVVFDAQALAIAAPTIGDPLDRPLEPAGVDGSDLAAGLRLARAMVPADAAGRIVLISDGNQTAGDALLAAREVAAPAGSRGPTPIDVAPVEYALDRETYVESVDAPPAANADATVSLRVVIVATTPSRGVLRVLENDAQIDASPASPGDTLPISVQAGRTVVSVPVALSPARTHRFTAIYEPDVIDPGTPQATLAGDTDVANNRGEAFTVTPGRGSILVLDGDGQGSSTGAGATLARVWRDAGLDVQMAAPDALPGDLLRLESYDLIVLQNVAADVLGPEGMGLISSYVRDFGGGLITLGGREAYGAGGWKGSPLEALLPVSLDLPERLLAPEVAVVFVMDHSGSMGWRVQGSGRSQQDIANEAAAGAVKTLDPNDMVGVITFNLQHQVVVPLAPNTDPAATADRIMRIYPDGGTAIAGALSEARRQLSAINAKTKHVILLSDGQSIDAELLPDLARSMHDDGITISAIAIGDGAHVESMQSVAYYGGGTFYEVVNPSILPRIFLKAIRVIRTPLVREAPFTPLLTSAPSPLTAGISSPLPRLLGMNLTQPRPDPTAVYPIVTQDGEPILAHWQVELGQVVSFTSDAWKWGQPWLDWASYRTLWTQVARLAARAPATRGMRLSTTMTPGRLAVRLDAADEQGRPLDLLNIDATVFAPDGSSQDVRLVQVGPGQYEASVATDRAGTFVVVAKPRRGGQRLAPVVAGASMPDEQEFRRLTSNATLLHEIAGATGGRTLSLNSESPALFDRSDLEPVRASTPLWPVLVAWTLGVLLLDVGTRRIAWDRLVSRELRGRSVLQSMADATRDRSAQAAAALSGLAGRRGAAPRVEPSRALSELDAVDTAREAIERRRAARIAAARDAIRGTSEPSGNLPVAPSGGGASPPGGEAREPSNAGATMRPEPPDDPSESPLLRAKRRAQRRLEENADG